MIDKENLSPLQQTIIEVLKLTEDPEIPINIWDLGLIYDIETDSQNNINITMTLTSPHCPMAESLLNDVKTAIENIPDTGVVNVKITFTPPWSMDRMSTEAKLDLGFL
ncbi:MAG: metal-sulfur cluster assembly factor [Bacteroidales bacterium]|jgi:metal-sulfur cluster biosynthetic enzyme|nr:metal-sulfur cluster assembly factor [Bacteroidales bacterium]